VADIIIKPYRKTGNLKTAVLTRDGKNIYLAYNENEEIQRYIQDGWSLHPRPDSFSDKMHEKRREIIFKMINKIGKNLPPEPMPMEWEL
jgi:hypothetical protein